MRKILEKYDINSGQAIIVDYKSQYNQDIIDYFEESGNLEGFAELLDIDIENGLFTIKEFPLDHISIEYLMMINNQSGEYEYMEVE